MATRRAQTAAAFKARPNLSGAQRGMLTTAMRKDFARLSGTAARGSGRASGGSDRS